MQHDISSNVSLYFQIYNDDLDEFVDFDLINPVIINDDSESISIGIGPLIQKYLFSEISYSPDQFAGIRIKSSDYSNNFHSLLIERSDSTRYPELEIFYRNNE